MSDISNWSVSNVREAINDHYRPDPNDENDGMYVCERCGHKLYIDYETEKEEIPVPATLSQVSMHEQAECPHRDDAV